MNRLRFIILACLTVVMAACTQNDGHIGRLFGSWVLTEATLNGQPYLLPASTSTYWSFQNDIVRVLLEGEHHTYDVYFGTFKEQPDGILQLDFTHHNDSSPAGTGGYAAPEWMGFPATGVFNLFYSGDDSKMTLTYHRTSAETFVYKFSKTW